MSIFDSVNSIIHSFPSLLELDHEGEPNPTDDLTFTDLMPLGIF